MHLLGIPKDLEGLISCLQHFASGNLLQSCILGSLLGSSARSRAAAYADGD